MYYLSILFHIQNNISYNNYHRPVFHFHLLAKRTLKILKTQHPMHLYFLLVVHLHVVCMDCGENLGEYRKFYAQEHSEKYLDHSTHKVVNVYEDQCNLVEVLQKGQSCNWSFEPSTYSTLDLIWVLSGGCTSKGFVQLLQLIISTTFMIFLK